MEMNCKVEVDDDEDCLSEDYDSSDSENEIEYFLHLMSEENNVLHQSEEQVKIKTERPDSPSPSSSAENENLYSNTLPPRSNWEGKYNFQLRLHYLILNRKTDYACFSTMQNKLYISKDSVFRTMCRSQGVPPSSMLRATLYYISPEFTFSAVKRCPVHAQEDFAKGSSVSEHVLQSLHDKAIYEKDELTGRFSVVIPYKEPKGQTEFIVYPYKFTCYSSCCGGINRRPIMIYFTLENNGQQLGRQTLEVKVCSCPSRDLKQEEKKQAHFKASQHEQSTEGEDILPDRTILPEPETATAKECDKYTLTTADPKLYKFLMYMKEFYEISNYIKCQLDFNECLPT